jgi:hypothetical protein
MSNDGLVQVLMEDAACFGQVPQLVEASSLSNAGMTFPSATASSHIPVCQKLSAATKDSSSSKASKAS